MDKKRDDQERTDEVREQHLPEHELDRDTSVGGGIMSSGGTAVDRGTGTVSEGAEYGDLIDRRVDEDPYDTRPDLGPEYGSRGQASPRRTGNQDESVPLSGDPDENEPNDVVPTPYHRA